MFIFLPADWCVRLRILALPGVAWGRIDQVLMGKQEVRHVLQVDRSEKIRLIRCFVVAAGLLWDREIAVAMVGPRRRG